MKLILLFLLLFAPGTSFADDDVREKLNQLEAALSGVRQEQQSVYQSYQMTKELRLMEMQEGAPPMGQHPYGTDLNTPPPSYDDVLRKQKEHERRIQQYTDDLKSLSERYLELEKERKALLAQIRELRQERRE